MINDWFNCLLMVVVVLVKSMRETTMRCPLSASIVHGRDLSPHLLPSVSECCRVLPKSTMCCGPLDTDTVQYRVSAATGTCDIHISIIMRPSSLGGGRILRRTLSVRLSVRPVIVAIGHVFSSRLSVTDVLFGMHWGPHIVRPSRPHRFLLYTLRALFRSVLQRKGRKVK